MGDALPGRSADGQCQALFFAVVPPGSDPLRSDGHGDEIFWTRSQRIDDYSPAGAGSTDIDRRESGAEGADTEDLSAYFVSLEFISISAIGERQNAEPRLKQTVNFARRCVGCQQGK